MSAAVMVPTEGQWLWIAKPNGAVLLVTADGLEVMDCVRKGTQACAPRFASWPGLKQGEPRVGRAGVMSLSHSWFDADGQLAHPDARLIAASPALLLALSRAQQKLAAAMHADVHPRAVPVLIAEAHDIQAVAIRQATGAAA